MSECSHGNMTAHGRECPWCKNAKLETERDMYKLNYEQCGRVLERDIPKLRLLEAELAALRELTLLLWLESGGTRQSFDHAMKERSGD